MTHISDLPDEILFEIYKYLEVSTIKSLELFPDFTQSTKYYLYKHSLFVLKPPMKMIMKTQEIIR